MIPRILNPAWKIVFYPALLRPKQKDAALILPVTNIKKDVIKRTLKRYLQKCSDCSDHILSQEDLNGEIPGNSSSLDTFQELLSRARAAGE